MSNRWTIWLAIVPSIGIVLAAWLISRWEPMAGATVVFEDIRAIEMSVGNGRNGLDGAGI